MVLASSLTHHVTSMCLVQDDIIWFGDNLGYIHAYDTKLYSQIFTYKMEPDVHEDASPVRSIHYLPEIRRACVAMHNGRMFLCCADVIPSGQEGCEGTFVITELGSSSCIHSVASTSRGTRKPGNSVEIWCGESHGAIAVFSLTEGIVTSREVVNHNNPVVENVEVLQVLAGCDRMWTFVYPGCHVYQWSVGDVGEGNACSGRRIRRKLDCSKLVPSSESLKTIAIDEHFSPGRCQVASMAVLEGKLYVGTSWGCLIVADAEAMQPISIFRPFADEIQAIIPIREKDERRGEDVPLLVTLGKGYRDLIGRFVKTRQPRNREHKAVHDVDDQEDHEEDSRRIVHALLWKPDDWLCD